MLVEPAHGELFFAPIGVEFPTTQEGVQPDIVFVSRGRRGLIVDEGIRGAPDLVIEVLSPRHGTPRPRRERKLYERQGVEQYWKLLALLGTTEAELVAGWERWVGDD